MRRWTSAWVASCLLSALLATGCGGGGGSGGGGPPASFLTADPRGTTQPGSSGAEGGALAEPPSVSDASEAAGAIAREIEEADLARTDGDTLYLLNAWRGLAIVDLASVTVKGRLPLEGVPREMYLRAGRVIVLLDGFDGESEIVDVDVSNPMAPVVAGRQGLGEPLVASRLAGSVLYAVTWTSVRSFRVDLGLVPAGTADLSQPASYVHAVDGLLVVAGGDDFLGTRITLVDTSDPDGAVDVRGGLSLPGWVADEQKLHVGAGTLRVVTHDGLDGGLSHLFMISLSNLDAPSVLGSVSLARGEQLFATRFTDTAAYLVTFERVDPLWVVDLSNPASPHVTGELQVPGWSTHLVALPGRLVALGIDPSAGWRVIASLFDVSNPNAPSLLDRVDFEEGWSEAFADVKALGVFPADGLVLVPLTGFSDRLAVLDLGASTLDLRGSIGLEGSARRAFPHPRGLCAVTSEEVVVADPVTLAVRARATIAENVVDAARLPDGRLLTLVARRASGRLGDFALPLVPDRCFPYGATIAVTGWDDLGRCAYVVDFGPSTPTLSSRFDLGGGWFALGMPSFGVAANDLWWAYGSTDARLSAGGRLVVRGLPGVYGGGYGGGSGDDGTRPPGGGMFPLIAAPSPGGGGSPSGDGFVVIDVAHSRLDPSIEIDGVVSGFALDGEALLYTTGRFEETDRLGRPWMSHDLVRVDLATRVATVPSHVPGYVVAAGGGGIFTVEERWGGDWTYESAVVACVPTPGADAVVTSRLSLPAGVYDVRTAGALLYFTDGGGWVGIADGAEASDPAWTKSNGPSDPFVPRTSIGTVRLAPTLAFGPSIDTGDGFGTLLLPLSSEALVVRDGVTLEHWDLAGLTATRTWTVATGSWPLAARPDELDPASFLVALGYGGLLIAP